MAVLFPSYYPMKQYRLIATKNASVLLLIGHKISHMDVRNISMNDINKETIVSGVSRSELQCRRITVRCQLSKALERTL